MKKNKISVKSCHLPNERDDKCGEDKKKLGMDYDLQHIDSLRNLFMEYRNGETRWNHHDNDLDDSNHL